MDHALKGSRAYYARRELGLCVKCGGYVEDSERYVTCETCREKMRISQSGREKTEWRREYMRKYRAKERKTIEIIAQKIQALVPADDLKSDRGEIPEDHKCWYCEWARWHGDRFFCPLTDCIKTGGK